MTPWYRSIRTRIGAAVALTSLLSALLLGLAVDRSIMVGGRNALRAEALQSLAVSAAAYDISGTVPSSSSVGSDATRLPRPLRAALRPGRAVTWFDGHDMWAAQRLEGGRVLSLRAPGARLLEQRASMHRTLGATAGGVVLFALVGGWVVAGSITSRLRRAARAVGAGSGVQDVVGRGDGAARLLGSGPGPRDEVRELVDRIDVLTGSLAARLDRERAFSADVAHELRTPMTALVSAAELLPDGPEATLVRRQTVRLRRLTDDLLELARAEQPEVVVLEPRDLATVVRRMVEGQEGVTLSVVSSDGVRTEPRRLERVVQNLVANGLRHGGGEVRVVVEGRTVRVEDDGPGFPAELLRDGPRRFRSLGAAPGSGLGLSIVSALAVGLEAQVELAGGEGGAVVTVLLPGAAQRDARE